MPKKVWSHSLASPVGFEPTAYSLEGCCSIQLSYGDSSQVELQPATIRRQADVFGLRYNCSSLNLPRFTKLFYIKVQLA